MQSGYVCRNLLISLCCLIAFWLKSKVTWSSNRLKTIYLSLSPFIFQKCFTCLKEIVIRQKTIRGWSWEANRKAKTKDTVLGFCGGTILKHLLWGRVQFEYIHCNSFHFNIFNIFNHIILQTAQLLKKLVLFVSINKKKHIGRCYLTVPTDKLRSHFESSLYCLQKVRCFRVNWKSLGKKALN